VSSYFLAKSTTDLPVTIAPVFVYQLISYWMVGLTNTPEAFFKTLLMLIMVVVCAQSYGSLISAATSNIQIAQAVGPLSMILLILFGGFYLSVSATSPHLRTIHLL
jgi:ATP-binding cassette subfamily G (WHITE) protein 2 (SNQ2)